MAVSETEQGAFAWASGAAVAVPTAAKQSGTRKRERRAEAIPRPSDWRELPPDNELWDVHAAARFLKRSVSWVYHRAEDGTLPVKRLAGWGVRFIPSELRAWVEMGGDRSRR